MSTLLDHIERKEVRRVVDNFDSVSSRYLPYSELDPREAIELPYGTVYRLELRSGIEYAIPATDVASDIHPAHRHARMQLVRHIYKDQTEIGHKMMSAVYGGATRKEVLSLIEELLESMAI